MPIRNSVKPHQATRTGGNGGGVAAGDHDGDEEYGAGRNDGSVRSGSTRERAASSTVLNPQEVSLTGVGRGDDGVATGDHDGDEEYGAGRNDGIVRSGSAGEGSARSTVLNPQEVTVTGGSGGGGVLTGDHDGDEKYGVGRSGSTGGRTTSSTVLNPQEVTLTGVGGGDDNVEIGTIVEIDGGSGGSNVVTGGSTVREETSGSVPSLDQPLIAEQEGMAGGGGYQPADTTGLLTVGGDLAPHVLTPGEARAMGKPELAGYTIETDADGQRFAVPPDEKRAESAVAEWNADVDALTANPTADDLNVLAEKWAKHPGADLIGLSLPVYGETIDGYGVVRYEQQTPAEWAVSQAEKLRAASDGEDATTHDAYSGDAKAPDTLPAGHGADPELTGFTRYTDADGHSVMVSPDLNAGIKEIADAAGITPEQVFQSWRQGDIQLEGEGEGPLTPLAPVTVTALPAEMSEDYTQRDWQEAYMRSEEGRDAVARSVTDAIYDKNGWKGLAFQGSPYGLEGLESWVSTPPVRRREEETDEQYLARIKENNNPQQQGPWWGKLWAANSNPGTVVYRMDYDDPRNAGLVEEWKGQKAGWLKPGHGESAQDWANRVINQGDLTADAAAMTGRLFYPDGTGVTYHVNPAQNFGWGGHLADPRGDRPAAGREMTWDELAQRESQERSIGEGAMTAAELATAIIPTVGVMRAPAVAMTLARTTQHVTGPAARFIARTVGRFPGLSKVGGETGQQVATQVIGKAPPQALAEAFIEIGITRGVPLATGDSLQPGPILAAEYGTEVAGQGAGAASAFLPRTGRFGKIIAPIADVLGGTKRVALTDVPGTGWGEIPPAVRRAYQEAGFSPDEAAGLARLQEAAELDVTGAQARYILRDSGIDDVGRQDSIIADWRAQAQTGPSGIFTISGTPTVQSGFHVGADGTVSPVETAAYTPPGQPVPSAVLQYDPALTPEEAVAAAEQAGVDPGATPFASVRADAPVMDPTATTPNPIEGTLAAAIAAPIGIETAGATTTNVVKAELPVSETPAETLQQEEIPAPEVTRPTSESTPADVAEAELPGSETPSETPPQEGTGPTEEPTSKTPGTEETAPTEEITPQTPAPEETSPTPEPTPVTPVAVPSQMTLTPTQSSVQTAVAPVSSPTPGIGMPWGMPSIPGFPYLGGGRRPFRGGRAVGVNARVIEWTQPTQVTYDLDTGEINEEALGPPREIVVVERDLDAPLPALRHADVMEVLPSDTGVDINPRIGSKRSRATVLESGAFPGGVVAAGQNPRVMSWKYLTRISYDLDTDAVLETALTPPQELRILRSDADAPHNRRRRVDAAEVHATGGHVSVRSRADTKRSRASRPGGRGRGVPGGGKRAPRSRMVKVKAGPMVAVAR